MTIITNRFKFTFNIDKINNDFMFLRFNREKNGEWWGAKELDYLIGDDYKAMAVCYTQNYAYAMFDHQKNNGYELTQRLKNDPNFKKVYAEEITPENINNQEDNYQEILARLLLNSLGSSRSKFSDRHFSNLTGALLKLPKLDQDTFDNSIQVGEISLNYINKTNNEFLLNVKMATYRLKIAILAEHKTAEGKRKKQIEQYLKRPQYVTYGGTNSLKRWLNASETKAEKTYIKAGKYRKKAHQDFLDFSSSEDFEISRAGIFHQVIKDIDKYLSDYINIEFIPVKVDQVIEFDSKNLMLNKPDKLHFILEKQTINIIDLVNDENSEKLVTILEKELKKYFKNQSLISFSNQEIEGAFNIRIIHEEQYYQRNKIEDQYLASDQLIQRQNITIESLKKEYSAIVKTLIKELIIKQDISNKQISLFDWSKRLNLQSNFSDSNNQLNTQLSLFDFNSNDKLKPQKDWIFAMFSEKDEENEDNQILTFMTIHSDGSFEFEKLDPNDSFIEPHQYQDYQKYIEEAIAKEEKTKSSFKFEGFILSETGDINLIFRSDEITLPELEKIETLLKEIERELPENQSKGLFFLDIVNKFLQEHNNLDLTKFDDLCKQLKQNYQYKLSKKDLYNLIQKSLGTQRKIKKYNKESKKKEEVITYTANTAEATQFRDYLLEKYQIRFKFPQDNDSKDYLFDNSLNIKYFGETDQEAYYFVGDLRDKIQTSFKDACHIRKIVAVEGSKLIFQELLKTMDVDFVRTGQSTVIPFPFKYIREYQNLN